MENMKLALCITILLLFSTLVSAVEEELVFDKEFYTDESFIVEDTIYIVTVDTYERIILDFNDEFLVIGLDECKSTDYVRFCLSEIEYNLNKKEKEARIKVYTLNPDLRIERTIETSNIMIGDEVEVSVLIKNIGGNDAENVTYTDIFPKDIEITETEGVDIEPGYFMWQDENSTEWQEGSSIVWRGKIDDGDSVDFSYKIRPTKELDETIKARVTYYDGFEMQEEESNALRINSDYFFDIETKFVEKDYKPEDKDNIAKGSGEDEIDLGYDEYKLIIKIINEDTEDQDGEEIDLKVNNLDFIFPEGIQFVRSSYIDTDDGIIFGAAPKKISDKKLKWTGTISGSKVFVFKIRGALTGEQVVFISGEFENEEGIVQKYETTAETEVIYNELEIRTSFDENAVFDSGQKTFFDAYVQNPNDHADFIDLNIKLDIPWIVEKEIHLENLDNFSYKGIVEGFVNIPRVNKSRNTPFTINVSYKTIYGQEFFEEYESKIKIEPLTGVTIKTDVDSTLDEGDEATVTVKIRNNGNEDINNIKVTSIPDHSLNSREFSREVNLRKKSELSVLVYKIKAPYVDSETQFKIVNKADYTQDKVSYSSSSEEIIKVKEGKIKLDVDKEVSDDDLIKGGINFVDYTLTNEYEQEIKNITIYFPTQKEFDLVGDRFYKINSLAPGQTIFLNDIEQIRAKINDSINLEKSVVEFNNLNGDLLSKESNSVRKTIEHGIIVGPAIIIEKNISKEKATNAEEFRVELKLTNIGSEQTDILVKDDGKEWKISLDSSEEKIITYNTAQKEIGLIELERAIAEYSFEDNVFYTASNEKDIRITEAPTESVVEEDTIKDEEDKQEVFIEEEDSKFNIKYLYMLFTIIVLVVFLIWMFREKPKKREIKV